MADDEYRRALMENLGATADEAAVVNTKKVKLVRGEKITREEEAVPETEDVQFIDDSEEARRKREDDALSKATAEYYASSNGGYGEYKQFGRMENVVDEDAVADEEAQALRKSLEAMVGAGSKGTGSDIRILMQCPTELEEKARYLSPSEIAYCEHAPDPQASTAGRIAAKHAVSHALRVQDESLFKDIEVMSSSTKAPTVLLSGLAKTAADAMDVKTVKVTISHSGKYAIAAAAAV
eukprot:TRINITY_DN32535_c0_g1_i1.p1 TRINITY_DN32535_c0_g1~~TRINITY_DN32535_c0_g1_i1.p1  ORF type:complete len:256 (+),score=113.97 TRINITY_DN32535_c0_g1_i1:60-770(+)